MSDEFQLRKLCSWLLLMKYLAACLQHARETNSSERVQRAVLLRRRAIIIHGHDNALNNKAFWSV
jgi:hypothetical protein